jgi:hypothetical protein
MQKEGLIFSNCTLCPHRIYVFSIYSVSHSHFCNNFSLSQQLGALQTHTTDTFLFISHTTNVPLLKFRCNIFIGVRIIKGMPGLVASGTPCISESTATFAPFNIKWLVTINETNNVYYAVRLGSLNKTVDDPTWKSEWGFPPVLLT